MIHHIYIMFEYFADLLRNNIKKESWLWRSLRRIYRVYTSLRLNPISKRRWRTNQLKFESIIDQCSTNTSDFFVVQIGACDGVMSDPIHQWITKYRWRGILVEPQRQEFERLKLNYKDCDNLIFDNVAIAEDNGLRNLYKMKDEDIKYDWQRGVASFLPKIDLEQTEKVQCITFDTLLNRHHVERIDFLQIDVEGYDYKLLKLFDFERIKPKLIRYEHKHLRLSDKSRCKKLLKQKGYKIMEMEFDTGAVYQAV